MIKIFVYHTLEAFQCKHLHRRLLCHAHHYSMGHVNANGMHTKQLKSLNGNFAAAAAILSQVLWLSAKERLASRVHLVATFSSLMSAA